LDDLAKYSVTLGVARSLCDSWASCDQGQDWYWRQGNKNAKIVFRP